MRTVLIGAVESTRVALSAMTASAQPPSLVVTLPPDLAHRHSDYVDLSRPASSAGIEVHHTRRSEDPKTLETIARHEPDLVLVIGWSQLCSEYLRKLPRVGCLGYHPSALPKLRGRAVIPWTILLRATESGGSFFWLSDSADTGDIAAQKRFPIDPETETARSLYDKQLDAISELLPVLLGRLAAGDLPRSPQNHDQATICAKRTIEDGRIDWRGSASDIERLIRAVGPPYAGAFSEASGTRIVITAAAPARDPHRFVGLPGQVQAHTESGFIVMCGDGSCLEVVEWSGPDCRPRIHSKLGDWAITRPP